MLLIKALREDSVTVGKPRSPGTDIGTDVSGDDVRSSLSQDTDESPEVGAGSDGVLEAFSVE